MCRIEIPNRAIHAEVQARLEVDPSAAEYTQSQRGAVRGWSSIGFAFTLGVAMGWLLRL